MVVTGSRHSVVATHTEGQAFAVSVRGHTVETDQPTNAGGNDAAPTPLELISVGLAACIALYTHRYCTDQGFNADDLAVDVKPVWRENRIARFDVTLQVPDTIGQDQYAAILDVAQTCPVHNTLTHAPAIMVAIA